jgi:hypothetical protein
MTEFTSEFIAKQREIIADESLSWRDYEKKATSNYPDALDHIERQAKRIEELEQERRWIHQDKTMIAKKDGDSWCFVLPDFVNLHESKSEYVDGILYRFIEEIYKKLLPPKEEE